MFLVLQMNMLHVGSEVASKSNNEAEQQRNERKLNEKGRTADGNRNFTAFTHFTYWRRTKSISSAELTNRVVGYRKNLHYLYTTNRLKDVILIFGPFLLV